MINLPLSKPLITAYKSCIKAALLEIFETFEQLYIHLNEGPTGLAVGVSFYSITETKVKAGANVT